MASSEIGTEIEKKKSPLVWVGCGQQSAWKVHEEQEAGALGLLVPG